MRTQTLEIPIESNVYRVPERLREIDPNLRVTFHVPSQAYRVWGVDGDGDPYILQTFPYLDARVVRAVKRGYWIARNTGAPYTHMLRRQAEEEYALERRRERDLLDLERNVHEDMSGLFRELWPGWRRS